MFKKILELDRDWSYALRVAEKPGLLRSVAVVLAHSGDSWFWGAAMLVLWFVGSTTWQKWAVYQLWWVSILAAFVMALKFLIKRRRPEGDWGAIYRNTDPHSFPSGHAARAFLIALLASLLGPAELGAALWVWAPLVALARVAMGVHYLSDVAAGAIVGLGVAAACYPLSPAIFSWISQVMMPFWGFGLW